MRKRDCSTCRFDVGVVCSAPGVGGCYAGTLDLYRPRPYWTPAERAGIKAMGKIAIPGYFGIPEGAVDAIRAYVQAAIAKKGEIK